MNLQGYGCLIIPILGVIALIIAFVIDKTHTDAWRDFAQENGLTFKPRSCSTGLPIVFGIYHERSIRLEALWANQYATYSRVMVILKQPPRGGMDLCVNKKWQARFIGMEYDPIDWRFKIEGYPAEEVARFLSSSRVRSQLRQTFVTNFQIEGQIISCCMSGIGANPEAFVTMLCVLADEIDCLSA